MMAIGVSAVQTKDPVGPIIAGMARYGGVSGLPSAKLDHVILVPMVQDSAMPQVGVGVVFVREGRVFLAKRKGSHGEDTWASAGGHLEFGESFEECARREAMEELGLTVGELRFLCVCNIVAYGKHYVDIEFQGDIGQQEPFLAEPEGFTEFGWFPLDDLPQPLFLPMWYALDSLCTGRHYYSGD